jgi:hypothetical protein
MRMALRMFQTRSGEPSLWTEELGERSKLACIYVFSVCPHVRMSSKFSYIRTLALQMFHESLHIYKFPTWTSHKSWEQWMPMPSKFSVTTNDWVILILIVQVSPRLPRMLDTYHSKRRPEYGCSDGKPKYALHNGDLFKACSTSGLEQEILSFTSVASPKTRGSSYLVLLLQSRRWDLIIILFGCGVPVVLLEFHTREDY